MDLESQQGGQHWACKLRTNRQMAVSGWQWNMWVCSSRVYDMDVGDYA